VVTAIQYLIIFALLILAWVKLRRDFIGGLAFTVFITVLMPVDLRVSLPGALPELTIHRLVLIAAFAAWIKDGRAIGASLRAPLWPGFIFLAAVNFVSLCFTSIDFTTSLKRYIDVVVEIAAYYLLLTSSLKTYQDGIRILSAACAALLLVGIIAWCEKYTGVNPSHAIFPHLEADPDFQRMVESTFRQRILLGTGMSMGWPLALGLYFWHIGQPDRKRWPLFVIPVLIGACYFSQSRGPWLASAVAFAGLMLLGDNRLRRALALVAFAGGLLILFRPGVLDTVSGLSSATFQQDTHKGGTFLYRLELWRVAIDKISESPVSLLFGLGPGAGKESEIEWQLSYRNNAKQIQSWDNHFAYELFQYGLVGLFAICLLYAKAMAAMVSQYLQTSSHWRVLNATLLISCLVLLFMMTNVLIFVKNVNFLFWAIISASSTINPLHEECSTPLKSQDCLGERSVSA
jgi:hypothetical protein